MAKKIVLEPIDIYGNWTVTEVNDTPPQGEPFGLKQGSKFKIRNKGSKHVLIKKERVEWNGNQAEIPLTAVTQARHGMLFNSGKRLKAIVKFNGNGRRFEVSFSSKDNGVSLEIEAVSVAGGAITGGSGTAGRGG